MQDFKPKLNNSITFSELTQLNEYIDQEIPKIEKDSKKVLTNTPHSYLERVRLIIYYKLFNKYQKLYTDEDKIISSYEKTHFYFFNFNLLIVNDRRLQYYILIVILLYIIYLIPKRFTAVIIIL